MPTIQTTNIHKTDASAGFTLSANDTYMIAPGVTVASDDGAGISCNALGGEIINHGAILGATGVQLSGVGTQLINLDTGSITASGTALYMTGTTLFAANYGAIVAAASGVTFGAGGANNEFENHGTIDSLFVGIVGASNSTETVINTGKIEALSNGINIGGPNNTISIVNSGTIKCDAAIVSGSGGTLQLQNTGTILGSIHLDAANKIDTITNSGVITGIVELGSGGDVYNGAGGRSGAVFGEAGGDSLVGGVLADVLNGGAGIDTLVGGRGRDVLTGGTEHDVFDFNSLIESARGGARDVITDFTRGLDDIDLKTIDAMTGVAGNNKFVFIGTQAFHEEKGELRCKGGIVQGDVNGDGKADFEIKVNVAALSGSDFLL